MSNGFETCDQHTYLFATEGKDCPYCEIDRLKAELEEAKDETFKREARIMMYVNKNSDIKRQLDASQALLAEARAELEALADCLNGSSKATYTAEMFDTQLEKLRAEARQEAARECIEIIEYEDVYKFQIQKIKAKFGLEW